MKTIVIDSGSTKADVVDISDPSQNILSVAGMNPSTLDTYTMKQELATMLHNADEVIIYGAGIYDASKAEVFRTWFKLKPSTAVHTYSDLLGACRAASGDQAGIVSILGTGSNSCVYDGTQIKEGVPAYGYILGDEGGGTHLGRLVLQSYLYNKVPLEVRNYMESHYALDRESLMQEIYRGEAPNRYLAQYAAVLSHSDTTWKEKLLTSGFKEFIEKRILPYKDYQTLPLHFVGSIAFHYQKHMDLALAKYGLKASSYTKKPIYSLIEYHRHEK